MITNLEYKIDFANGESRSNKAEFKSGSTMITGKNGRGKSLNLELIAFSLFGSVALRGKADDYKRIKVTLEIEIRGIPYTITRTKSNAEVFNAEKETLVKGNKPTNEWIIRTLGFNYDVFRISHWCAQGDIQALADMKPTERKKMVDSVAGLTQMDGLIDVVSGVISTTKKSIATAEQYVVKPTAPEVPNLPALASIESVIEETQKQKRKLEQVEFKLNSWVHPDKPVQPQPVAPLELPVRPNLLHPQLKPVSPFEIPEQFANYDLDPTVIELGERLRNFLIIHTRVETLKSLIANTPEDIVSWGTTLLNLDAIRDKNNRIDQAKQKKNLLAQGDTLCTNCNTRHPIAGEALLPYQNVDVAWADEEPILKSQVTAHENYVAFKQELEEKLPQLDSWEQTKAVEAQFRELVALRDAHNEAVSYNENERQRVEAQNKQMMEYFERDVANRKENHEMAVVKYNEDIAKYEERLQAYHQLINDHDNEMAQWEEVGQDQLWDYQADLKRLNDQATQWAVYNSQLTRYESDLRSYEEAMKGINKEREILENHQCAKEALVEIKTRVKSYVIPSLNTVASYLINQMTGGEFSTLKVDEEFEVTVDDKPLRTLSGSGKDIANLAIRIGLGRILTHSVLPVMMLDEIDAAMDEERAEYTWNCIQQVTPKIGQVLQVSHKNLPAQHTVVVA